MKRTHSLMTFIALAITFAATNLYAHGDEKHAVGHDKQIANDSMQIRNLINHTFDKPNAKVSIDPIVVLGNRAVADWFQDGRGGRAVLEKAHGKWVITLCAGEGVKKVELLQQNGYSKQEAEAMVKAIAQAEAKLSKDQIKTLDSFEGIVNMSAHGDAHQNSNHGHSGH